MDNDNLIPALKNILDKAKRLNQYYVFVDTNYSSNNIIAKLSKEDYGMLIHHLNESFKLCGLSNPSTFGDYKISVQHEKVLSIQFIKDK